jgi:Skp family chaperone for outer membrane proteins
MARADDAEPGDQPARARASEFPVAAINVASAFHNYEAFKQGMVQLKEELALKDQDFKAETQDIQSLVEQLKSLDKLSEEYRELAEEVAARQSSLKVRMERAKKELMTREAELYAKTYREVQEAVANYAKAHGIRMVIRHSDEPMDPSEPASVMKGVNRNIVYQDGIDITEEILRILNEKKVS